MPAGTPYPRHPGQTVNATSTMSNATRLTAAATPAAMRSVWSCRLLNADEETGDREDEREGLKGWGDGTEHQRRDAEDDGDDGGEADGRRARLAHAVKPPLSEAPSIMVAMTSIDTTVLLDFEEH